MAADPGPGKGSSSSAPAELELEPDPRCLRGLRFTVRLPSPEPDRPVLLAALAAAIPNTVAGVERWGPEHQVDRLLLQFRVELRVGERPGQVVVLFRSCCPVPEREQLAARVLEALRAVVG